MAKDSRTLNSDTNNIYVPDGGWGWMVVLSSFMINFLLDGVAYSFGLLLPPLMDYFGSNKGATSWISSVLNGMYLSSGPIAAALVQMFGARKISICGAIIAASGLFLSTFSANLSWMIVLYGAIGGFGFGLTYLPSIVVVGQYFEKRRAFATGIAVCGSGIGGFVFAPLLVYLLDKYSWKGALWVISGIVLNGVIFSGFYRPLQKRNAKPTRKAYNIKNPKSYDILDPENNLNPSGRNVQLIGITSISDSADIKNTQPHIKPFTTERSSTHHHGHKSSKADKYNEIIIALNSITKFLRTVLSNFDFALLKSPTFVVYGISCFLCMFAFYIPLTFLPNFAKDVGFSTAQQAMLVSAIGISGTIGRVVVGLISDRPWANTLIIYNTSFILAGIATGCVPFVTDYWILISYSIVFGGGISAFACLRSILMIELLGKDRLTSSFGLVVLCEGAATFIGSPIGGSLADWTGNYDVAFYVAGITLTMAGVICIPLRIISRLEQHKSTVTEDRDA